jgi:hypothetical protein
MLGLFGRFHDLLLVGRPQELKFAIAEAHPTL